MTWQILFTLTILAVIVAGLVRYDSHVDIVFASAVALFAAVGIISPAEAFAGFANEGMLTVGALFVVGAGVIETGLLGRISGLILGTSTSSTAALRRLVPSIIGISAFLNNTTVVAMAMPALLDWSRRRHIAPSRLLLPLSYAAILGGVCTLIGTSTNLVVHGMLKSAGLPGLGMWELGAVGIPIAVLGGLLLIALAPRLPERKELLEQLGESRREFLVEMQLQPDCPLAGKSITDAGLRNLPGLFVVAIERGSQQIVPVGPDEILAVGDRLVFTGVVSTIVDLQRIRGLVPTADDHTSLAGRRGLFEAVISASSPLIGRGIREAGFRTVYDAAVIAAHRSGERLGGKIGDIVLRPGDTLLLATGAAFLRVHRNNPDFYLVSQTADVAPDRGHKAIVAGSILLGLVVLITIPDILAGLGVGPSVTTWLDDRRVVFAFLAAGATVVTRCTSIATARRQIDWSVLVIIGAAFGISKAMVASGTAGLLARLAGASADTFGPLGVLAVVYWMTWALTEIMSNNAAAALMFPIALAAGQAVGVSVRPFAIAVAIAASGGFLLPIGYQTHLMVFGPGGYRQSDFLRIGLPMGLLWFAVAMLCIPIAWPLR